MSLETQDKKTLTALVGTVTTTALLSMLPQLEGTILRGYKDPIGIVTACAGHTKTAVLGKPYTEQECEELLISDTLEHAQDVNRCYDLQQVGPYARAGIISFAYNVGSPSFCASTFRKKLIAKDPTACAELSRWVFAGTQILPGLVTRRQLERQFCERDYNETVS